jgi:hypothetical protein
MSKYYTQPLASELIKAYCNTDYCFIANNEEFIIRLNEDNRVFASFLEANQIMEWAYITVWNPYSVSMPKDFNSEQQLLMLAKLEDCRTWKGEGRGQNGCWTPEESYFIADLSREKAIQLGQEFGQNAILIGNSDGRASLIKLFDSFKYSNNNGRLVIEGYKKRHTHYLDNLEINPIRLGRVKDLVNSDGPILSLHKYNGNLYLSSHLKDGSGKIYYATNEVLLEEYLQGKITINNLLDNSPSIEFTIKYSVKSVYNHILPIPKTEFKQEVQCGSSLFTELPSGMGNENINPLFS